MKRKLEISDLKLGMYVSELDRPWIDTPFLFQGFRITNQDELDMLAEVCDFALVDVEKSKVPVTKGKVIATEPTHEINPQSQAKPYTRSFEDEYNFAKTVFLDTQKRVNKLFNDTRLGKNILMTDVSKMVYPLADSIFRNPDTLTLLSNIQEVDENLEAHSINTCILSLTFARHLGLDKSKMYELGIAALLHDIGEIQIDAEILRKRGNLSGEEQKILQSHCALGATALSEINGIPQSAVSVAQNHHERTDKSGYPNKLGGEKIGFFTKIISVVDVYDTLTTGLASQPALTCSDALKNMYDWREGLFDAEIVEEFIQCLGIYPIGSAVELNTGDLGVIVSISEKNRLSPSVMLIKNIEGKTYLPPRIVNIAFLNESMKDDAEVDSIEIVKVISPDIFNMDLKSFILRELTMDISA